MEVIECNCALKATIRSEKVSVLCVMKDKSGLVLREKKWPVLNEMVHEKS